MVDHEVLLQRLRLTFGIDDIAHRWFQSYLSGRHQHVRRGSARSSIVQLVCGVPQGSVLGPVLFVLYTADLISLIESHGLNGSVQNKQDWSENRSLGHATDQLDNG